MSCHHQLLSMRKARLSQQPFLEGQGLLQGRRFLLKTMVQASQGEFRSISMFRIRRSGPGRALLFLSAQTIELHLPNL